MITETDLKRIMREGAGQAEGIDLDGDITDVLFSDLGYDSLAVLETVSRIEREYGIRIPEDALSAVRTPGEFLALANRATAEAA
ncbi:acyl carrier protein [Kitasatospora sp. A2-31]|uniref:acyl carrier protein n=1 Tax=Kitasatospora sp. A2-31 TaxID=2916414 RepID=UPI001EEA6A5D|nr:acyl carrier protein [Kitasatospora sp. A2-31]MCG6495616.1 acyl carrier protein [Kitasatospora sp. A2-31]